MTTKRAEYLRTYRAENREKRNEYNRILKATDPERLEKRRAYDRARWDNPEYRAKKAEQDRLRKLDPKVRAKRAEQYRLRMSNPKYLAKASDQHRARKYGLRPGEFDTIFAKQGFACANNGCKVTDPDHKNGWCVDHCHTTGRVRGILCNRCNIALGMAKDCKQRLMGLVDYLGEGTL